MSEITKGKANQMRFFWDEEAHRCEEDKIVMLQAWACYAHYEYLRDFVRIGDIKNQLGDVRLVPAVTQLGNKGEVAEQTYNESSYRHFVLKYEEVKQGIVKQEKSAERSRVHWQKAVRKLREAKRKYKRVRGVD